jgi:hypothetical protein
VVDPADRRPAACVAQDHPAVAGKVLHVDRPVGLRDACGRELAPQGRVEPPTFRFSGLRTTVHHRSWKSFYLHSTRAYPAIDVRVLTWMRPN